MKNEPERATPPAPTWPRVYCDDCGAIVPLTSQVLPADDLNGHPSCDLLCPVGHVVATLHGEA